MTRPEDDTARRLPGAAQLELARRLAEVARRRPGLPAVTLTDLVDRAMERSGPGRGLPVLPLDLTGTDGDQDPAGRVGAPPTDPADVPAEELVRLGVGLLVDELLRGGAHQAGDPADPGAAFRRRGSVLSRPVAVAGAATSAAALRAESPTVRRPGRRRPHVLLLATPMDDLLGQAWSARVQRGAPVPWDRFVRRWARRDALPPAADLATLATTWADRVGPENVHVVAGPDPLAHARPLLGREQGGHPGPAELLALPARGLDLLRRVNQVLAVRLPEERQAPVRRTALGLLPRDPAADGPGLVVPQGHRDWVTTRAARLVDDLRAGGYPVHGDLDRIVVQPNGRHRPRRAEVLGLLLDTLLEVAERNAGRGDPDVGEGTRR